MFALFVAAMLVSTAHPQPLGDVPPEVLVFEDGRPVQNREDWLLRRVEMIALLTTQHYGGAPPLPAVEVVDEQREDILFEQSNLWATQVTAKLALGGVAVRVGYWKPRDSSTPLPAILANEPVWWPNPFVANGIVERVLARGYIFAGFWNDDFASFEDPAHRPVPDLYPDHDWGTVAVAAWAYRVTMNWLETVSVVNAEQVAIWGHSRRGKACAWAGATDERFAAVIPHMSGMGGTALYRVRSKGAQELEQLLERYWLHPSIYAYIDDEERLPFDQHFLHALIAPRPMYAHVGRDDAWGNPKGEIAAWKLGWKIYEWLGAEEACGIYIGDYGHNDPNGPEGDDSWETALQFLDKHFRGKTPEKSFDLDHAPVSSTSTESSRASLNR